MPHACIPLPGIKMAKVARVLSLDPSQDVVDLRDVVQESWTACLHEYMQIVIMRLVDAQYSQKFFSSTFHDIYEFYFFSKELNDPKFPNRRVWRAWRYIRPLVLKYADDSDPQLVETIRRLNHGYTYHLLAWSFKLSFIVGPPPIAAADKARPSRTVSREQWDSLAEQTRNTFLNEAREICGYEGDQSSGWEYSAIFD
jgi:hypothetical protein